MALAETSRACLPSRTDYSNLDAPFTTNTLLDLPIQGFVVACLNNIAGQVGEERLGFLIQQAGNAVIKFMVPKVVAFKPPGVQHLDDGHILQQNGVGRRKRQRLSPPERSRVFPGRA